MFDLIMNKQYFTNNKNANKIYICKKKDQSYFLGTHVL